VSILFSFKENKQNVLVAICISRRKNEKVRFEKTTTKQKCKPEGNENQPHIYHLYYDIVSVTLGHLDVDIAKYLPNRHQQKPS